MKVLPRQAPTRRQEAQLPITTALGHEKHHCPLCRAQKSRAKGEPGSGSRQMRGPLQCSSSLHPTNPRLSSASQSSGKEQDKELLRNDRACNNCICCGSFRLCLGQ